MENRRGGIKGNEVKWQRLGYERGQLNCQIKFFTYTVIARPKEVAHWT